MWVQKTKAGTWQYFERYTEPVTNRKRVLSVTRKGHSKADIRAAQLYLDRKAEELNPGDNLTLHGLIERYVAYKYKNLKKQTAFTSENHLKRIESRLGKDTLVSSLTASYVRDKLSSDDPAKLNERLKHFKAMLRWGYRNDLIADISFLDKIVPNKTNPRLKLVDKFLEPSQVRAILDGMDIQIYRDVSEFLVLSGLRVSEAIALTTDDINVKAREISVTKTYAIQTGEITSTKTTASERILYMQNELLRCVKRILKTDSKNGIFLPYHGELLHYDAYRQYLGDVAQHVLGRRITPHIFRHTNVALLAANGIQGPF